MRVLRESLDFDWDLGNLNKNFYKHQVTNKEAEEVFLNKPKFTFKDEKHSQDEDRYGLLGITNEGRFLSVVYTLRDGRIRIITVRNMSSRERKAYEKIKSHTKI